MNVPIETSAATSYVLSQPTMSTHSQMAPPDAPTASTPHAQPMAMSTPPHVASPHLASPSPVPPGVTGPGGNGAGGTTNSGATQLQFSQGSTSVATVMSQSPTVIQTMPTGQGGTTTLQFSSQMPVFQQGTLGPAGYLQPLYQTTTGQQHMLLSPAGSLALQQQLGQGQITVMTGPGPQPPAHGSSPKMGHHENQGGHAGGKTILAGQQNKGAAQVITSQNSPVPPGVGGKMTVTSNLMAGLAGAHKGSPHQSTAAGGQIVTNLPQAQFVTQPGSNGQTLLISSLGIPLGAQGSMLAGMMGGTIQATAAGSPQPQLGKAGQAQQQQAAQVAHKFLPSSGQQKGAHSPSPLQLTGLPAGTQYRHLSPVGHQQQQQQQQHQHQQQQHQQLIAGQPMSIGQQSMLGPTQTILGSLQAFNAFGATLPWATGQLQGQQLLQSPILIRNQHDGSVYIQGAPAPPPHAQQQHQQQQHQLQQAAAVQVQAQQLQNAATLGGPGGMPTVQQMSTGMPPGTMVHASAMPTLLQAQQQQQQQQQLLQPQQQHPTLATQQTPPPQQQQQQPQLGLTPSPLSVTSQQTSHCVAGAGPPTPVAPIRQQQQHQQQNGSFQPIQQQQVPPNSPLMGSIPAPVQAAIAPRLSRPGAPQHTSSSVGVKISGSPRSVRGLAARQSNMSSVASANSPVGATPPSQPQAPGLSSGIPSPSAAELSDNNPITKSISIIPIGEDGKHHTGIISIDSGHASFPVESTDIKPIIMRTGQVSSVPVTQSVDVKESHMLPIATMAPVEFAQQPITTVPVVTLPDAPDLSEGNSASPAIGAPFPEEAGNVPDTIEQASEILTHIIEGYVIRESSEPFPVSRSALLSEMIRREQANAGSKERKRKLENNNNNISINSTTTTTSDTNISTNPSNDNSSNKADGNVNTTSGNGVGGNDPGNHHRGNDDAKVQPVAEAAAAAAAAVTTNLVTSTLPMTTVSTASVTTTTCPASSLPATPTISIIHGLAIDQLGLGTLNVDVASGNDKQAGVPQLPPSSVEELPEVSQEPDVKPPLLVGGEAGIPATSTEPGSSESSGFNRSPALWNVQDVFDFIKSVPGCAAYAEEFRSQEIDGEALLFLKAERHLMSQMNIKVGPAAKIYARLNQLCTEYGA